MFCENLKYYRKAKGYTQEELAERIHVVRQTVSKWEMGLSVPDVELLQRLAEVLDVEVAKLLGQNEAASEESDAVAVQLARIADQMAIRNRRWKRVLKIIGVTILGIILVALVLTVLGVVLYSYVPGTGTVVIE